jgi:hypothetical protein
MEFEVTTSKTSSVTRRLRIEREDETEPSADASTPSVRPHLVARVARRLWCWLKMVLDGVGKILMEVIVERARRH